MSDVGKETDHLTNHILVEHTVTYGGAALAAIVEPHLRPLRHEATDSILERLGTPEKTGVVVDGKVHIAKRYAIQFFNAWMDHPTLLLKRELVVHMTAYFFTEFLYLFRWDEVGHPPSSWEFSCLDYVSARTATAAQGTMQHYEYEGLMSVRNLFLEEADTSTAFARISPQSIPKGYEDPAANIFPVGDLISFQQWQKGCCIAFRRFGEDALANEHGGEILGQYAHDPRFLEEYAKAFGTSRLILNELKNFAFFWDKFDLPIRFWKKKPAWYFARLVWLHKGDYNPFTRLFFSQTGDSKHKRAPGLANLNPHQPSVVIKWDDEPRPVVTVCRKAAEHHGFSVEACQVMLEKGLNAKVRFRH